MRDFVQSYLEGRLSRRGFFDAMARAGFTAAAAQAVLEPLEASESAADSSSDSSPSPAKSAAPAATKSMRGTGGELVVAQAKAAGSEYVFANPGSMEVGFYDALTDDPGIHLIMGLHEGIVISMADGYHKLTGKPAFVNIHMAAGTAQASGQLYNSSRDGSAIVVTAGFTDNEVYNDDLILSPRPGFDQRDIVRQWMKMANEARVAETLALMTRRAFKMAATEPGGPVYLALSEDALSSKNVESQILPAERFMLRSRVRPETAAVEEAARWLIDAKRPVLLVGDDVWNGGAQDQLMKFAERLGLPVAGGPGATAFQNFPPHHDLWVGSFNNNSGWAKRGVDLIIMIGCRNDFGSRSVPESPLVPSGARIVRVGVNTMAMGRTTPTDLALVGDVKESLQDLMSAVETHATRSRLDSSARQRRDEVRAYSSEKLKQTAATAKATFGHSPMHPHEVGAVMARTLGNAVIVSENLTAIYDAFPFGYHENDPIWITNSGHGLGWGIGAATGAKVGAPHRLVVCSIGDGSVMYSASGFWTQVRSGIPVLTVVWNNRNYQTVRQVYYEYQGRMAKSGHYPGMHLGDPDIDFVKLAESQGVKGAKASNAAELEAALKKGMAASQEGKSFLVDVATACYGGGAGSTWFDRFNLFESLKKT